MNLSFDRHSLIIDGKPTVIRSGAMHYFRLPGQGMWENRLRQLKAAGYNTVDLYFNWDFHSPAKGQYDFTGIRDIKILLNLVEAAGLYLIARPGPYINAETARGALPGWLLNESDVVLRCRENGHHVDSPAFVQLVKEWYAQIVPFFVKRSNLLMVQVENEYATEDMEPDYIRELAQYLKSLGVNVPLMHNDFYAAGLYADEVELYAIDNYAATVFDDPEKDWHVYPELFSVIDTMEENLREEFCPERPLIVAELQAGWFAGWAGADYEMIRNSLGRNHIGLVTRSALAQGVTIFNHYLAVGCTNWDHIGATDVCTSYDFAAPIAENGIPTERLYEAKRINQLLEAFNLSRTASATLSHFNELHPDLSLEAHPAIYKVRQMVDSAESYWIFTRNFSVENVPIPFGTEYAVTVPPFTSQILPVNVLLTSGWTLTFSGLEPLSQSPHRLLLSADISGQVVLEAPSAQAFVDAPEGIILEKLSDTRYRFQLTEAMPSNQMQSIQFSDFSIWFLGKDLADTLWNDPKTNDAVLGAELALVHPESLYQSPGKILYRLSERGSLMPEPAEKSSAPVLPELNAWQCKAFSPWQVDESLPWQPLSAASFDMDSQGIHEGAVWYRFELSASVKSITLWAQHLWGAWLTIKGQTVLLGSGETFQLYPGQTQEAEDTVVLKLPETLSDSVRTLWIYVENIGHHKGFFDDIREPRGILALSADGKALSGWILRQPASFVGQHAKAVFDESPILYASSAFNFEESTDVVAPLSLLIHPEMSANRLDMVLNGVLIGRYWKTYGHQTRFVIPQGLLQTGINSLEVIIQNFQDKPGTLVERLKTGYAPLSLLYDTVLFQR